MQFRVLGPLEVEHDGHPIEIVGSLERELLGILLVSADEVVSVDRLVDALWGFAAHERRTALQVHVCNLRRTLQPHHNGEPSIIETHHPGYVLHVDDEELDAARFERRLIVVRSIRHADPVGALARLESALAMWRGPALTDFEYRDWARPEIVRLTELLVEALEDRLEALLDLGRNEEVVADARRLLAEYPANERFCAAVMLALYRTGRQAEALRVYAELCTQLGESIGIEPSPLLKRLERQIVMQDATLSKGRAPHPPRSSGDDANGYPTRRRHCSRTHPHPGHRAE